MSIFLWIIGILLLLFIMILFVIIHVEVDGFYTEGDQQLNVTIYALFGMVRIKRDILSLLKVEKDKGEEIQIKKQRKQKPRWNMKMFIKNIREIHTIVKKLLKRMTLRKWTWHSYIGTGDAALTGMLSGLLWTIKGWVIGGATHYFRVYHEPDIEIHPIYQQDVVATKADVHITFPVWAILLFGIALLRYRRKLTKDVPIPRESTVEQGGV